MSGARKALVSSPTRATAGDHRALARSHQVMSSAVFFNQHLRPGRHCYRERRAVGAVPQSPLTMATALSLEVRAAAEALEIPERVVAHQEDVAAAAAVATVRAALGHVRLTAEAQAAIPAGSGRDMNAGTILHCLESGSTKIAEAHELDVRPRFPDHRRLERHRGGDRAPGR